MASKLVDCPTCGGLHAVEAVACPRCGQPVDRALAQSKYQQALDDDRAAALWSRVRWGIILALLVVACGAPTCCMGPAQLPAEQGP